MGGYRMFNFRNCLAVIALAILLPGLARAQVVANQFDACAVLPKKSVSVNFSSATTTQLVGLIANQNIFVCDFFLNQANGAGSLKLVYGTGTNCGTGTTNLTGPIFASTVASGVTNTVGGSGIPSTQAVVPSGNALCATTTGTIQQSGWLTYIQATQPLAASFYDPCIQLSKLSAPINFSSATTTALVTPTATNPNPIYVCQIVLDDAGLVTTPNTTTFKYGTKVSTDCDTGATSVTGPYTGVATTGTTSFINGLPLQTQLVIPAGKQLCATTSQASTVTGYVTYVYGR